MIAKRPLLERLRLKKMPPQGLVSGVVWYTAEAWAKLKETSTDPDRFEATFGDWQSMAEATLRDLLIVGVAARKVSIDPEEFTAWCELCHEKNDASARARFVSEKLRGADNEKNA